MYGQLDEAMAILEEVWSFDIRNYPAMEGVSDIKRRLFAINHILKHQAKALGSAFEVMEPLDHGSPHHDEDKLRKAAVKFFANALRLAKVLNLDADYLVKHTLLPFG